MKVFLHKDEDYLIVECYKWRKEEKSYINIATDLRPSSALPPWDVITPYDEAKYWIISAHQVNIEKIFSSFHALIYQQHSSAFSSWL